MTPTGTCCEKCIPKGEHKDQWVCWNKHCPCHTENSKTPTDRKVFGWRIRVDSSLPYDELLLEGEKETVRFKLVKATPTTPSNTWEEEFDKQFEGYWRGQAIPDEIKFFIRKAVPQARTEERKEADEESYGEGYDIGYDAGYDNGFDKGKAEGERIGRESRTKEVIELANNLKQEMMFATYIGEDPYQRENDGILGRNKGLEELILKVRAVLI